MFRSLGAVLTLSFLFVPGSAVLAQEVMPKVAPEVAGLSAEGLGGVTTLLEEFVAENQIAGAVAGIARGGQIAYLEAIGSQDLATGAPMTEGSLFRIYSMAKAVTAVAVMMLHEEGRFELDDPVSEYLPAFDRVQVLDETTGTMRAPSRPITIRDLLLHTSGLSHRNSELYQEARVRSKSIPMDRFIGNIVAAPLLEDPGTVYRYSESPTVLGGLVEVWSGQPLDEFLQERIFAPLGMTGTGFWVEPDRVARLTTVYRPLEAGGLEPFEIEEIPFTVKPQLLEGAVGLVSTVPDYLRFGQMLLNEGELGGARILRAETVREITSNGLSDSILEGRGNGIGWGLGNVNVIVDPEAVGYPSALGEYGWNGSAGTIFWVNPAEDMVVVLMWQRQPTNPDQLQQQAKTLIHEAIID